jgi:hypothetical protein
MPNISHEAAYKSTGESVHDLFDSTELGFFVPMYQREYTWEEDNINQLFDDLLLGIRELVGGDDDAATFLGTAILTNLSDRKQTVVPGENNAQPTAVMLVIDGQQRISTIALISIQLVARLRALIKGLPAKAPYKTLHDHCADLVEQLTKLHSIRLGRGSEPPFKPRIIRATEDRWTYSGNDKHYNSPVAHYLATFIRGQDSAAAFAGIDPAAGARVRANVTLINQWLDRIADAHIAQTELHGQFPTGTPVVTDRMQESVLGFKDKKVRTAVAKCEANKNANDYFAAAVYQLFLLSYYLLRRCGVNRLQPSNEEWGFDMFQALNATGTPLTAMETFLPQVMQAEGRDGKEWLKSPSREHMDEIDDLFGATTSNEQKTQRTNELLGTFALCYEGERLGNKFSAQRRWMTGIYEKKLKTIEGKREFLGDLARAAMFYHDAWYMEDPDAGFRIAGLAKHAQGEFASLLVHYLRDASSKLSAPILARFYSQALDGKGSFEEFIEAAKACTAFFTLWRSSNTTSGLDDIYRRYFSGSTSDVKVKAHNLQDHQAVVTAKGLKEYFSAVLEERGVRKREAWIARSEPFLVYSELKTICRFVLFLAGHDRVPDPKNPGLTLAGTKDVCPLLTLTRWIAKDHKSLEHVAPQRPPDGHSWDPNIYMGGMVNQLGNLLLLPVDINKFVDNKEWAVKYLHYAHVGSRTASEISALKKEAQKKGVVLSGKAIKVLEQTSYSCAVEPLLTLGVNGAWDAVLIEKRTRQIKEIAWKRLDGWLSP